MLPIPPEMTFEAPDRLTDELERLHREREDLLALPSTSDEALELIRRIVAVTPADRACRLNELNAEIEYAYNQCL